MFYIASSFLNADILTVDYFKDSLESLGPEEFNTSIGSIRPSIEKGSRFYQGLDGKHFYQDGLNYKYYDDFGLKDAITENSAGLKYVDPKTHLEAGFDAGNMMSLVIGQEQADTYRIVKNMHTINPTMDRALRR